MQAFRVAACASCGCRPEAGLSACAACGGVSYCNRACQKDHWRTHKTHCSPGAARGTQRAAAHGAASVCVACDNCGRLDPAPGVAKLLACACNTVVYCSTDCQRQHRSTHKEHCQPVVHTAVVRHVSVNDASECVLVDRRAVETLDVSTTESDELHALQDALSTLSGDALELAVSQLVGRYKTMCVKFEASGETFEEAAARNARSIALMCGNRLCLAKQEMDRCGVLMRKFDDENAIASYAAPADRRMVDVHRTSMRLNTASINAQVLNSKNYVECREIAKLGPGAGKRERTRKFILRMVDEMRCWEEVQEWDRCVELDFAVIKRVAADEPTPDRIRVMYTRATHALRLIREHRASMQCDWSEREKQYEPLMEKWSVLVANMAA